ncbi:MAG: cytochrome c oxidase subunit 3 [Isosphaeraceae bacterium]
MAHATADPTGTHHSEHAAPAHAGGSHGHHAPITPGKVAMWLFLATEVMFFTGLIGSYIVLRSGSPATGYSTFFPPATDLSRLMNTKGVELHSAGENHAAVAEALHKASGVSEEFAEELAHHGHRLVGWGMTEADAAKLRDALIGSGANAEVVGITTHKWPLPYDNETNPLSIDLTAVNTFILICSSVTMVLALSAVQRGQQGKFKAYLLATFLIGSVFLSVQVYEYRSLMFMHHYPPGISKTGHFTPDVSLFASCFFTMTGFHGAHVFGGVVMLGTLFLGSLLGKFTRENHAAVEIVGLYWHFVDLVWIILFTVVYLI